MEQLINFFLQPQNGILGVIVVALMLIIVWQQRRLDAKDKSISDLQDKRKLDTDAYTKSYTDMAKESVAASRDSINSLNLLQRSMDSLTTSFQSFISGKGKS